MYDLVKTIIDHYAVAVPTILVALCITVCLTNVVCAWVWGFIDDKEEAGLGPITQLVFKSHIKEHGADGTWINEMDWPFGTAPTPADRAMGIVVYCFCGWMGLVFILLSSHVSWAIPAAVISVPLAALTLRKVVRTSKKVVEIKKALDIHIEDKKAHN